MGWDGMPASRDRTGPRGRRPEDIRVVAMVSSRTYGFLLDALSRHITAATVSVSPIQASRALSGLPIEASVLVIEPEYLAEASAREKIALPLLVDSINCAFAARTLLLCGCTANSLRTLHGLAGLRRSELFVLEVDGAQLLSSLIVNSNASAASGDPHGVLGSAGGAAADDSGDPHECGDRAGAVECEACLRRRWRFTPNSRANLRGDATPPSRTLDSPSPSVESRTSRNS